MIRIAAVGDVHFDRNSEGRLSRHFDGLTERADLFLIAGDLTQTGSVEEGRVLARDLARSPVPVVAVLGNHDYHMNQESDLCKALADAGVCVLDRDATVIHVRDISVGIAGVKGFGGGFPGASGSAFGEREMKEFMAYAHAEADALREALESLDTSYKIALTHYSPIADTLLGEPKEIYPFLGSYLLAEPIDAAGVDIAFHGHAHKGVEKGSTEAGIPVRNVAMPVIRHAFNIYLIDRKTNKLVG